MKYEIKIKDECIVFDGIGKLKLEDLIISLSEGVFRGDYVLELFKHASNQKNYGSCPPLECKVCAEIKNLSDSKKV